MISINNVNIDTTIIEVVNKLREQLASEGTKLIAQVRDTPDNVMISCPYHKNGQERRPSAGIKKSDGTFHCFACGEVHDLPELISNCLGYDDFGVVGSRWLLNNFVVNEERDGLDLDLSREPKKETHEYVSEEELDKYRYIHPYMYRRGLTNEVIELFDIGYDDETRCITFPVRDVKGNCLFVARRSVDTKFFNYPKGIEKPLYGLYELYSTQFETHSPRGSSRYPTFIVGPNEIIVCESMLDALSFWTIGKPAVALNGLGNELQFKQLRDLPCRHIILATDMDAPGRRARQRLRHELHNKLIWEYEFPAGRKDANDCTKEELMNLEKRFI